MYLFLFLFNFLFVVEHTSGVKDGIEDDLNSEFVQLLHNSLVFVVCGVRVCVSEGVSEREKGARESESKRYSEFVQLLHNSRFFF